MHTIAFTSACEIRAADASPTVRILAYGGGMMRLPGFSGPVVVDLSASEFPDTIPLLVDHKNALEGVIGRGTPTIEAGKLFVVGTLAAGTAAADQILALHRSGVGFQASIGAEVVTMRHIRAGDTITVNSRAIKAPSGGMVLTTGLLREVSIVPLGADGSTSVSIAANFRSQMMADKPFMEFASQFFDAQTLADMSAEELAHLHANYRGQNSPSASDFTATAPFIHASADPVDQEQRRLRRIDAATAGDWGDLAPQVQEIRARGIGGEISDVEVIQEMRAIRRAQTMNDIPLAHAPSSSRYDRPQGEILTAALCLAGGLTSPEQHFSEQILDAADRMRGVSLQMILMEAACAGGYRARPGESISDGNLRSVLSAVFAPQIQATGWSTNAIPNVLSNTANKMLLDGFSEMPSDWRSISSVKNVKNFKEHTWVRLLDSLEFEELAPGGELKHGTLGDATLTGRATTYGKMLSITRTDIINDDLGALTDVPRRLGRAAAQKFNTVFWTAFLATADNFWHSNNSNVLTGAGTELDVEGVGMTAALKAFRAQRSSTADGSKLIGGRPAICMVPPTLEIPARRLLNSSSIVSGTDGMIPASNPFAGLATLVVVDQLEDDSFTGYSAAKWYLFRSPGFAPAMLVPALNGRVEPVVETADADFAQLGIQMRGYADVGVARGEPLCGLQMAGTPAE